MAVTMPSAAAFLPGGQFMALSGSSGPSKSTMSGPTAAVLNQPLCYLDAYYSDAIRCLVHVKAAALKATSRHFIHIWRYSVSLGGASHNGYGSTLAFCWSSSNQTIDV